MGQCVDMPSSEPVPDTAAIEANKEALMALKPQDWAALKAAVLRLPKGLDLTDDSMDAVLEKVADDIIALFPELEALEKVDLEVCANAEEEANVTLLNSLKLARSKLSIAQFEEPVHVTVVVPVYKETNRILNRREHKAGEDFVRRKLRQTKWLDVGASAGKLSYDYLYVDDGCPSDSGKLVQAIIDEEKLENHQVIFLQEAIDKKIGKFYEKLTSAKTDSRKGGAVMYGFYHAAQTKRTDRRHIFAFTDSDLSTHMGQTGVLIAPIVKGAVASAGARYINGGVYCSAFKPTTTYNLVEPSDKKEKESDWVHLCNMWSRIFFRDRLLPPFATLNCVDTQCGFKALDGSIIDNVVADVNDYWSTIDIELIMYASLKGDVSFVPVVWSESMAESNFWGEGSVYKGYFEMNATMLGQQRKYIELKLMPETLITEETKQWNALVDAMTLEQYETMIKAVEAAKGLQKSQLLSYTPTVQELAELSGVTLNL